MNKEYDQALEDISHVDQLLENYLNQQRKLFACKVRFMCIFFKNYLNQQRKLFACKVRFMCIFFKSCFFYTTCNMQHETLMQLNVYLHDITTRKFVYVLYILLSWSAYCSCMAFTSGQR